MADPTFCMFRRGAVHASVAVGALLLGSTAWVAYAASPALAATPASVSNTPIGAADAARLLGYDGSLKLAGSGALRVLGFDIYDARLWVSPGFAVTDFAAHTLSLELTYKRAFRADQIASRSLTEMRRQTPITDAQAVQWKAALVQAIPNVVKGDRIVGVYRPGQGAAFVHNGRFSGKLADPEAARLFFGIWLSDATSEPRLRDALVAGLAR
jgi:hypothetical protein